MRIGIIGAGAIGQALASQASKAGYEVTICNSRGPESLAEVVTRLGVNVTAGSLEQTLTAEVIFLAIQWHHLTSMIHSVSGWDDKIVVDSTNPILPGLKLAELNGQNSSEVVAALIPGAKVVKAFNTFPPYLINASPEENGGNRVIFYSGNDPEANKIVADIIGRMGFAPVYLGNLKEGGKLQQFPTGTLPGLNLIKLPD